MDTVNAPADPLLKITETSYRYGPWEIDLYPMGAHNEWQWCHKDYDGAPDANDNRYGFAPSLTAAQDACDDWEACDHGMPPVAPQTTEGR